MPSKEKRLAWVVERGAVMVGVPEREAVAVAMKVTLAWVSAVVVAAMMAVEETASVATREMATKKAVPEVDQLAQQEA